MTKRQEEKILLREVKRLCQEFELTKEEKAKILINIKKAMQ